jgi:hypothetical protein
MGLLGRCPGVWPQILGAALLLFPAGTQDRLAELHAQFEHEIDPVRKAKLMPKLEVAEFVALRKLAEAGDYPKALVMLGDIRDQIRDTAKALDERGVDAEKKPAGFKELQIAVREAVRDINDVVFSIPEDWQRPFHDIRQELDQINKHLILELFPRQPGHAPKDQKKKS